jgi:ketosteroid isomerase-like protein
VGQLLFLAVLSVGAFEFEALLDRLAQGWNQGDARKASECFTEDALYVEPPDRQLYRGREELYRFFGGEDGRPGAMSMTWHNRVFDERLQLGFGEFTFAYGSQVHGSVFIELREGRIHTWREYWYESDLPYAAFVGASGFTQEQRRQESPRALDDLASAWNRGDADDAAALFAEDAIYLEPPDRQRYAGREAIQRFFAETARGGAMSMTWHRLGLDPSSGIGAGEYTFEWQGKKLHGIAWVQIRNGLIQKWREYQYSSDLDWEEFVAKSRR